MMYPSLLRQSKRRRKQSIQHIQVETFSSKKSRIAAYVRGCEYSCWEGLAGDSALFSSEPRATTITYQIQAVAGMGDHDGLKVAGVPETLLHSCRDRRVAARTVAAAERDVPVYIYNIATTRAHQSSMPLCEEL